jgi:hypothetical protein
LSKREKRIELRVSVIDDGYQGRGRDAAEAKTCASTKAKANRASRCLAAAVARGRTRESFTQTARGRERGPQ